MGTERRTTTAARDSIGNFKSETTEAELIDLGIYVQEYELYLAKQLSDILPILKSMPRVASSQGLSLGSDGEDGEKESVPTLAAA